MSISFTQEPCEIRRERGLPKVLVHSGLELGWMGEVETRGGLASRVKGRWLALTWDLMICGISRK